MHTTPRTYLSVSIVNGGAYCSATLLARNPEPQTLTKYQARAVSTQRRSGEAAAVAEAVIETAIFSPRSFRHGVFHRPTSSLAAPQCAPGSADGWRRAP